VSIVESMLENVHGVFLDDQSFSRVRQNMSKILSLLLLAYVCAYKCAFVRVFMYICVCFCIYCV